MVDDESVSCAHNKAYRENKGHARFAPSRRPFPTHGGWRPVCDATGVDPACMQASTSGGERTGSRETQ